MQLTDIFATLNDLGCDMSIVRTFGAAVSVYARAWLLNGYSDLNAAYFPLCTWHLEIVTRRFMADKKIGGQCEVAMVMLMDYVASRIPEWMAEFEAIKRCRVTATMSRCLKAVLRTTTLQVQDVCRVTLEGSMPQMLLDSSKASTARPI